MGMSGSIREVVESFSAGRRSASELCAAAAQRIAASTPLHAFVHTTEEHAARRAAALAEAVARGESTGSLAGVPLALKDNICTRFGRTTCGSRILERYVSPYDATVVERIERAGAMIVGKTNMDEFGMGSSTENSAFGPTRNPWAHDRVPGGSSGGSAAAVAAGVVPAALGSDTGGSVRQPAALCGVVGLKPTYGRVSRYGLVAFGSSLDVIGVLARTVEDAARVLGVMAGHDPRDATSLRAETPDYAAGLSEAALRDVPKGVRIGVPRECFGDGLDADVRAAVEGALAVYRGLGAQTVELSLPHLPHSIAAYYVIATAEASSNLARFDGVHYGHRTPRGGNIFELYSRSRSEGFGAEVKRRIMLGTFALSAGYHDKYYDRAVRARRLIAADFERAWEACDVIACPTTPAPAFRLGEKTADPLSMYLADVYTVPASLAGLPAISIPCGRSRDGLPIGLQLIGKHLAELDLMRISRVYERARAFAGLAERENKANSP